MLPIRTQLGISWSTILNKRENFRKVFSNYDLNKIAQYDDKKFQDLMQDAGIIRNKLKISATITNATAFINIQKEFGSFNKYIWSFVGGKPIINHWESMKDVPPKTEISDAMSKDLKKRGFRFVGSTICYAFMQAAGLVNDHKILCFRYEEVLKYY